MGNVDKLHNLRESMDHPVYHVDHYLRCCICASNAMGNNGDIHKLLNSMDLPSYRGYHKSWLCTDAGNSMDRIAKKVECLRGADCD
jgi:hypothetical protein